MFIELSSGLFDTKRIVSVSNDAQIGPNTHRAFGFVYFAEVEIHRHDCTQDDYAKLKSILVPVGCRADNYEWVQPKGTG